MNGHIRRALVGLMAAMLVVGCVVAPAVAASKKPKKKTHQITLVSVPAKAVQTGVDLTGAYTGTFGNCTMKGKLVIPNTVQTITCKGGTFVLTAKALVLADNLSGTFTIAKGTGKYKGISGKGKFSGVQSKNEFTYKGTAKY
jgi:PBP1b-binding outer membrane lipoprotein LpoB